MPCSDMAHIFYIMPEGIVHMNDYIELVSATKTPGTPAYRALRAVRDSVRRTAYSSHKEEYRQWKLAFTTVHGTLDTQRVRDFDGEGYDEITPGETDELLLLIYALETYYAVVLMLTAKRFISSRKECETNTPSISEVLDSAAYRGLGFLNMDCPKQFAWIADSDAASELSLLIDAAWEKEVTVSGGDFIKIIYESVFPSQLRHSMGEVYTPDWLAAYAIDAVKGQCDESVSKTWLDPTCGSGTFLVQILNRMSGCNDFNPFLTILGFDLNPIAVLAAKVNFIIHLPDQCIGGNEPKLIPIYLLDIINDLDRGDGGDLFSVEEVSPQQEIMIALRQLGYLKGRALIERVFRYIKGQESEIDLGVEASFLRQVFACLSTTDADRLISLMVASAASDFDYVVGNPPWVNWEYLPTEYKFRSAHIWQEYKLFDLNPNIFNRQKNINNRLKA